MSSVKSPHTSRSLVLFLMILVVIGPLLFAWFLVKRTEKVQLKQSNYGDILPAPASIRNKTFFDLTHQQSIPSENLLGKWWLVYVGPEKCYQECQGLLYDLKQVQMALGKDSDRVGRLFVSHPNCPTALCETFISEQYPELIRIKLDKTDFARLFPIASDLGQNDTGELYLIDPLGNVMMHYEPDTEPKGILRDLKRLLRVSKIG